ncbi:DinB family protein [Luteipulveratus halotolerans]|uniref:Pentapeptide repeat-containing protein n=1 Tax=Luteipulveratus halotolerans TaxID=1631356 RepID=A0A0L6CL47_9MICO|nr:DinB family protein [Luteipulveratus halotolerans]KNX38477.1 pentapeptide repeat-containing protein [Luteipulveratus halotolerans]
MAEFIQQDLTDSRFEQVDLTGSRLSHVDLSRTTMRNVAFDGAVLQDVDLIDVTVTGDMRNLVINEVDVTPLIEAELDRRQPGRVLMRPTDADGFRRAWDEVERIWASTVETARGLDPALLHESVDGEWSFIETLRHLSFATDAWVRRGLLGDPSPWRPLDLPWDQMPDTPGIPRDRSVRPSLDEVLELRRDRMATVLELRRDRMATVRAYVDGLTDADLDRETEPVDGPGWPPPVSFPVRKPLLIVLNEEWEHRRYAERDLATLAATPPVEPSPVE